MQNRFLSFMDIEGNKGHYAYQVWQSILSIANGGVAGVGAGQGTGKWGYVPLAHSDFIFAIVAEEFGLIGALSVIGGFLVLAYLGIKLRSARAILLARYWLAELLRGSASRLASILAA